MSAPVIPLDVDLMDFAHRLAEHRHRAGLTQQALADRVGIHVSNIRRYEGGTSQPTLDVLRNLALALSCSADSLLFDEGDRGPSDDLRLQFEAASTQLDDENKQLLRGLIEAILLRNEARRWANAS